MKLKGAEFGLLSDPDEIIECSFLSPVAWWDLSNRFNQTKSRQGAPVRSKTLLEVTCGFNAQLCQLRLRGPFPEFCCTNDTVETTLF